MGLRVLALKDLRAMALPVCRSYRTTVTCRALVGFFSPVPSLTTRWCVGPSGLPCFTGICVDEVEFDEVCTPDMRLAAASVCHIVTAPAVSTPTSNYFYAAFHLRLYRNPWSWSELCSACQGQGQRSYGTGGHQHNRCTLPWHDYMEPSVQAHR